MWEYRYWRLVENALKTKDWLLVFSFLGEFKLKCLEIAKMLVDKKFKIKEIDSVDYRYSNKGSGEIGIYLIDGVIVRVAKVYEVKSMDGASQENTEFNFHKPRGNSIKYEQRKPMKKEFDKRAVKNLHQ